MSKYFTTWVNINWSGLWVVVTAFALFWGGLSVWLSRYKFYPIVAGILAGLSAAFLFAARGGKYVADRTQTPPADGKP